MTTTPEEFKALLRKESARSFGLCMFAPAIMAPAANRRFNTVFGDGRDNLSVPMVPVSSPHIIRYWAGNYSSASIDRTVSALDVLASVAGAVLLITERSVTATNKRRVIGLLENGMVRSEGLGSHSFNNFSSEYLHVARAINPSNAIEGLSDFGVTISAEILGPDQNACLLLRTPWERIFQEIQDDPSSIYRFSTDPRAFEEFIADTYRLDDFDVELTPRSNDGGVDVIASKDGFGAIKILDQAKAFSEHRVVTANDVRAALGVLNMRLNASKMVITTTSEFAPGVYREFSDYTPSRLELRPGQKLIEWLKQVSERENR